MKVGFMGLGQMGEGMARNILKASHDVTVYNRTRSKVAALEKEGARVAAWPADLAGAEVVITMLADDGAVEAAVFGEDGLLATMPAGATHLSMSTIGAALAERLAFEHGKRDHAFLAAPVFGRPEAAAAAKLFIVVAGQPAAIARCQPLFDAMGQRTFVVGDEAVAASILKLTGNFLIASVIESLGEAMALVRKAGIDPRLCLDILTSTLFTAPIYKSYGELIVEGRYQPAGFKAPLGLKDIRLALAAAEERNVPMPVASLIRDHLLALIAQQGEALDWAALAEVAARNAGLATARER